MYHLGVPSSEHVLLAHDDEPLSLASLLNDRQILHETIEGNELLFDFYCKPQTIQLLFAYIVDPTYNASNLANLNYAQLCSEILCIDINPSSQERPDDAEDASKTKALRLMARLHGAIHHSLSAVIPPFWAFLATYAPLPSNVLTYFVKVNSMLLLKFPLDMVRLVIEIPHVVAHIQRHLQSPSSTHLVQELLYRLWAVDDQKCAAKVMQWFDAQGWTLSFVGKLSPTLDADENILGSQVLANMITFCQEGRGYFSLDTVSELLQRPAIDMLWSFLTQKHAPSYLSAMAAILDVYMELIRLYLFAVETNYETDQRFDYFFESFARNFSYFDSVLNGPKQNIPPLKLSCGAIRPLGVERLKVCEFLAELIHLDTPSILAAFHEYKTSSRLLTLFFEYEWNNFLHAAVVDFVVNLFRGIVNKKDSQDVFCLDTPQHDPRPKGATRETLVYSLFKETRILKRILAAQRQNDFLVEKPRGYGLGYMGHLFLVVEAIYKLAMSVNANPTTTTTSQGDGMSFLRDELGDPEWLEYEKRHRIAVARQENILGGGPRPIPSALESPSEGEEEPLETKSMTPALSFSISTPIAISTNDSTMTSIGNLLSRLSSEMANLSFSRLSSDDTRYYDEVDDDYDSDDEDERAKDDQERPIFSQSLLRSNLHGDEYEEEEEEEEEKEKEKEKGAERGEGKSQNREGGDEYSDQMGTLRTGAKFKTDDDAKKKRSAETRLKLLQNRSDLFVEFNADQSAELQHCSASLARYFVQHISSQLPPHFVATQTDHTPEDGFVSELSSMRRSSRPKKQDSVVAAERDTDVDIVFAWTDAPADDRHSEHGNATDDADDESTTDNDSMDDDDEEDCDLTYKE